MTQFCLAFMLILLLEPGNCSFKADVNSTMQRVISRAQQLYGNASKASFKLWELESEDRLGYPRGDKKKLSEISKMWTDYYECSTRLMHRLTASGGLPGVSVTSYLGSIARVPCGLCVAPDERDDLVWVYAESPNNLTLAPLEEQETTVREKDDTLSIHRVSERDAGAYRCEIGRSAGGVVVLEIVDYEDYTVVKPQSSRGPYASPPQLLGSNLVIFTRWGPWSECSRCGRVGRRRRYGMCYVRRYGQTKTREDRLLLDDIYTRHLFNTFPDGIACQSHLLPPAIKALPAVRRRRNEVMLGLCKVPCRTVIFTLRTATGRVLERANNSAGVYSLAQKAPQPPEPARDIIFATRGAPLVLRCPGTTLRDVPVTWRVGSRVVVPRAVSGRMRLDARDRLVFALVVEEDGGLYSCWEADALAGTIKLVVWGGAQARWNPHLWLAVMVVVAAVALRVADRALRVATRGG